MGNTLGSLNKPAGGPIAFTFGPEIELVLKFKPGRYEQAVTAFPALRQLLTLGDEYQKNLNFSVFIAALITNFTNGTVRCLAATSEESKELKSNKAFHNGVWQAAVDATLHANQGECMGYLRSIPDLAIVLTID